MPAVRPQRYAVVNVTEADLVDKVDEKAEERPEVYLKTE